MSGSGPSSDRILTPQTIVAVMGMLIFGGTVAYVLLYGDSPLKSQTVGGVMAFGGLLGGFYFASSSGSQKKDATISAMATTLQPRISPP